MAEIKDHRKIADDFACEFAKFMTDERDRSVVEKLLPSLLEGILAGLSQEADVSTCSEEELQHLMEKGAQASAEDRRRRKKKMLGNTVPGIIKLAERVKQETLKMIKSGSVVLRELEPECRIAAVELLEEGKCVLQEKNGKTVLQFQSNK